MFKERNNKPANGPARPNGDTTRSLLDIELALAVFFNYEKNIIAYNVHGISYLLPIGHESDMLVLDIKSRKLTEVEIKRTWADFCNDFKKDHHHETGESIELQQFWYCVPKGIYDKCVRKLNEELVVPSGIITYDEDLNMSRHYAVTSFSPDREGTAIASTYTRVYPHNNSMKTDYVREHVESGFFFKIDYRLCTKPVYMAASNARPLFTEQVLELARLGCMRQVALRERIRKLENNEQTTKEK